MRKKNNMAVQTKKIHDLVIRVLEDFKAVDVVSLDVTAMTTMTDMMVICTGTSSRHLKAMANELVTKLKQNGVRSTVEGADEGQWVLVDLGDVIVHMMSAEARDFYNLEQLWDPTKATLSSSSSSAS